MYVCLFVVFFFFFFWGGGGINFDPLGAFMSSVNLQTFKEFYHYVVKSSVMSVFEPWSVL